MAAKVDKFGQDLRKVVKSMSTYPIFSSKWFSMLGSLQHITEVAVVEQKEQAPEGNEGGTLWERNELIVRYMLEEGKLNLCLRLLIDFKTMQRNEQFADALQNAKAKEPEATFDDLATIKIKAAMFEQGLGTLLSCSLGSIESLQTLDIPALIVHISDCLKFSLSHSEMVKSPDADRRQEVLCHHYLAAIFGRLDDLQEDRIMEVMQENDVFSLVVTNVAKFHEFFSVSTKVKASKVLTGSLFLHSVLSLLSTHPFNVIEDYGLLLSDWLSVFAGLIRISWFRGVQNLAFGFHNERGIEENDRQF